ncbi:cytochrome P450 2C1-like isoform X2 [Gracilinanus agilis]|uniref:cytochrome P450 2C1-like isoform X2 n=1 Tax=Gracilinanus agilis TaxID=191870 RepID=UPI001CFE9673|nr:cytochrome P450 2C1-like isoform X2 [Gracilinanus agilis]
MDFWGLTTLALVCFLFFQLIWNKGYKARRLPPGPIPLPILGNMLQMDSKDIFTFFDKMAKKYGPVYTVYMGLQRFVVLHGYEAIKEALIDQGDDFLNRAALPIFEDSFKGHGILSSNGEKWRQNRRFSLMTLRNFGMGKRSIEERVQEEAQCLVDEFQKTKGQFFDPTFILGCAPCNVICSILFNNRFNYDDKTFLNLMRMLNENFRLLNTPWIQEKLNPQSVFNYKELTATGSNLFAAGTETTSSTLRYGLLLIMKYPKIQAKVHEEIDRVLGSSRKPSMQDRVKMPYVDAVVHEIQRYIHLLPFSLPRLAAQDIHFQKYVIPKGTNVFPLLYSILYDRKAFPNPYEFDPENFLDKSGNFQKNDHFVPFSLGKRLCLGESLARMELFLFLTTILQNFTLKPMVEPKELEIIPLRSGIVNIPSIYKLALIPR